MNKFMNCLFQSTVAMSVITILCAVFMPFILKKHSAKWRYIVWLAAAIGWIITVYPIGLLLLPYHADNTSAVFSAINNSTIVSQIFSGSYVNTAEKYISLSIIIPTIWAAGVVFITAFNITKHMNFIKIVGRWSESETNPKLIGEVNKLAKEMNIKTSIGCKTCGSIASPMLVGLFKPVILMPSVKLSDGELSLIIRHELTHLKRHDLWYRAVVLIACVLHWFNPVVYLMARATALQCEISCDEAVLYNTDIKTHREYAEAIIAVVRGGRQQQTALSTSFYGGKRGMKNRIMFILDFAEKTM